ncbi:hypothetical protein [Paenibacillus taiwanensis]|uniref:hypothetical protein n=1 Tax=Paenibacillus taiwanensis TaxID=401638 RepID=UPI00041D9E70|nr:hypothetical protein [Paenibacillus taiwanensis]
MEDKNRANILSVQKEAQSPDELRSHITLDIIQVMEQLGISIEEAPDHIKAILEKHRKD